MPSKRLWKFEEIHFSKPSSSLMILPCPYSINTVTLVLIHICTLILNIVCGSLYILVQYCNLMNWLSYVIIWQDVASSNKCFSTRKVVALLAQKDHLSSYPMKCNLGKTYLNYVRKQNEKSQTNKLLKLIRIKDWNNLY